MFLRNRRQGSPHHDSCAAAILPHTLHLCRRTPCSSTCSSPRASPSPPPSPPPYSSPCSSLFSPHHPFPLRLAPPSRAYSTSSSYTPKIMIPKRRTQITSQPLVPLPPIPHRHMQRGIAIPIPDIDVAGVVAEDGLEHISGCILNPICCISSVYNARHSTSALSSTMLRARAKEWWDSRVMQSWVGSASADILFLVWPPHNEAATYQYCPY